MYQIKYTSRMKHDVRIMQKRGKNLNKLIEVLDKLSRGESLSPKNRDHQLAGALSDFRECHIEPDWLLMYQIFNDELILSATATGSHSDLFGK
ncbi:MAG: type II toxin-antitoxin system YafQ family toxin [Fibrobacter sp.]|nr:type II toxin-antitoxin system YafQ family toxin [Fibrobacter sp.]